MTDDVFWSVVRTYIDDKLREIEYQRLTYRLQKSSPKVSVLHAPVRWTLRQKMGSRSIYAVNAKAFF